MPSASAGLELPATSLMAPLLLAIPLSWSPFFRRLQSEDDPGGDWFQTGLCAENSALIQAGSEAGNMNQGLVPAGFFAFLSVRKRSQWRAKGALRRASTALL